MTNQKVEIFYTVPTGMRGRPAYRRIVKLLPVTRGPTGARIANLAERVLPLKATFVKFNILA